MPTNIGVAKRILSELLGLSPKTMDKVIRQIQASGDTLDIQTNNIRKRMGPQALTLIMKGMDASGSVGDYEEDMGDDEDEDDFDKGKFGGDTGIDADFDHDDDYNDEGDAKDQMDLLGDDEEDADEIFPGTKKDLGALKIRERIQFSLKDFLINEDNMVSLDLSDPAAATAEIRKLSRIAKNSPDRLRRLQMQDVRDEKAEAADAEGPTKGLQQNIANTKQKLVMLNKRLADQQKREGNV